MFLLGGLSFCPRSATADDAAPKATATRPTQDRPGQTSLPNTASPVSNAVQLISVRDAPIVLALWGLLRVLEEIRTGDIVVNSDLGTTKTWEVFFSHVSARAIEAVCLLMVDSLDLETLMWVIPWRCFIGMHNRPFAISARMNEAIWFSELKTAGQNCRHVPEL